MTRTPLPGSTAAATTPAPPGVSPGGSSATAISRPTCRITWPFTGITVSASRRSSPSTWLPVGGGPLHRSKGVAEARRADVAKGRPRGRARQRRQREPGRGPTLVMPLHQCRALALDHVEIGPLVRFGHQGQSGAIDAADGRVDRNLASDAQVQEARDALAELPDPSRRRGLDPEAAQCQISHRTAIAFKLEQRGGRPAVLGPRIATAVELRFTPAIWSHARIVATRPRLGHPRTGG